MKKNLLVIAAIGLAGALAYDPTSLPAQNAPPIGAPPSTQNMPPGTMRPRPRGGTSYRSVIATLQRAKAQLQRDTHDYDGHRQSALDACEKAIAELQIVQKSVDEARAAAVAAARAAAEQQQTNQAPTSTAPAAPQ